MSIAPDSEHACIHGLTQDWLRVSRNSARFLWALLGRPLLREMGPGLRWAEGITELALSLKTERQGVEVTLPEVK